MIPDLRHIALHRPTGYYKHYSRVDNPTQFPKFLLTRTNEVAKDHACLFSCIFKCWESAHWLHPNGLSTLINSAHDMRLAICNYIRNNPEIFSIHTDVEDLLREKKIEWDGSAEDAVSKYSIQMENRTQWGGYPEIDAAALLLGVVVRLFVAPESSNDERKYESAVLAASFFPRFDMLENEESVKSKTKFVLMHQNSHFTYATPQQPKDLAVTQTGGGSGRAPLTAEEINLYRNRQNAKKIVPRFVVQNSDLLSLRQEREKRVANQKLQRPAIDTDEEMAKRLQSEEHQKLEQMLTDSILALSLVAKLRD